MTIFCPAYGGLLSEYRIKMQLFTGAGVKIFGEPGTLYQIGNRPLRSIETLAGYTNEHQWMPAHVKTQYGNWPSANIPDVFADGETITIYYPATATTVGLRANGTNLGGKLPPATKKVFLLLRNDLAAGAIGARVNWSERGVSLANFQNWDTIRPQVEHLMMWNYAWNTANTIDPNAFRLPEVPLPALRTLYTVGVQDTNYNLPFYDANRFPSLEWISEEYAFKTAYNNQTPGGREPGAIHFNHLPPIKYGLRFPGFNVAGADATQVNTWLAEINQAGLDGWNIPQAAPGGTFRMGPGFNQNDGYNYLTARGYTVPNENA